MTPQEMFDEFKKIESGRREKFSEKERERLDKGHTREGDKRDKLLWAIFSIFTGSSIPFVFGLLEYGPLACSTFLLIGWILLLISLIIMLVNYFVVLKDFKLRYIELEKFDKKEKNQYEEKDPKKRENVAQKWVERLNWISASALLIAIIFLVLFFYYNVVNISNNMENKTISEKALSNPDAQYVAQPSESTSSSTSSEPIEKPATSTTE